MATTKQMWEEALQLGEPDKVFSKEIRSVWQNNYMDLDDYINLPQNREDHPLAISGRKIIEALGMRLTHDFASLSLHDSIKDDDHYKRPPAGMYLLGFGEIFINTNENENLPMTYMHEIAHHIDFAPVMGTRLSLIVSLIKDRNIPEEAADLLTATDELTAQTAAALVCRDHGVISGMTTLGVGMRSFLLHPHAAELFFTGQLDQRIKRCYDGLSQCVESFT